MNSTQLAQIHWDISRLLEMGVDSEFIQLLNPVEIRDLLKGLLYLKAKYPEDSEHPTLLEENRGGVANGAR